MPSFTLNPDLDIRGVVSFGGFSARYGVSALALVAGGVPEFNRPLVFSDTTAARDDTLISVDTKGTTVFPNPGSLLQEVCLTISLTGLTPLGSGPTKGDLHDVRDYVGWDIQGMVLDASDVEVAAPITRWTVPTLVGTSTPVHETDMNRQRGRLHSYLFHAKAVDTDYTIRVVAMNVSTGAYAIWEQVVTIPALQTADAAAYIDQNADYTGFPAEDLAGPNVVRHFQTMAAAKDFINERNATIRRIHLRTGVHTDTTTASEYGYKPRSDAAFELVTFDWENQPPAQISVTEPSTGSGTGTDRPYLAPISIGQLVIHSVDFTGTWDSTQDTEGATSGTSFISPNIDAASPDRLLIYRHYGQKCRESLNVRDGQGRVGVYDSYAWEMFNFGFFTDTTERVNCVGTGGSHNPDGLNHEGKDDGGTDEWATDHGFWRNQLTIEFNGQMSTALNLFSWAEGGANTGFGATQPHFRAHTENASNTDEIYPIINLCGIYCEGGEVLGGGTSNSANYHIPSFTVLDRVVHTGTHTIFKMVATGGPNVLIRNVAATYLDIAEASVDAQLRYLIGRNDSTTTPSTDEAYNAGAFVFESVFIRAEFAVDGSPAYRTPFVQDSFPSAIVEEINTVFADIDADMTNYAVAATAPSNMPNVLGAGYPLYKPAPDIAATGTDQTVTDALGQVRSSRLVGALAA